MWKKDQEWLCQREPLYIFMPLNLLSSVLQVYRNEEECAIRDTNYVI